jgi:hypothetical protein
VRSTAPPETMRTLVELVVTLRDVTGGNPLFLRELLRELDEQLVKQESTADLAETIAAIAPVGVRALVDLRFDQLTDQGREVICAAAVVGREITVDTLAAICKLSRDAAFEALEEGLAARLLVEDYHQIDRYLFPHVVVRNAVYATIPLTERQLLHRRIAELLDRTVTRGSTRRSADIAHHYVQAAPLGLQREAAAYAERAAEDADNRFAFGEAARWYECAIRFVNEAGSASPTATGNQPDLGRLQLALGRAWANDQQMERARDALLAAAACARAEGDAALLADVALEADGPWADSSVLQPDALSLLEEALPGIDPCDSERLVRVLTGIANDLYYADHERQERVANEALAIAQELGEAETLARALLSVRLSRTHRPEALCERLALSHRAHELASLEPRTRSTQLQTLRSLVIDLLENHDVAEFNADLDTYEASAHSLGSPRDIYWSMVMRATQATMHGDLAAGEQLARGAALRGRELEVLSDGAYLLQRFVIRYLQGRLTEEVSNLRPPRATESVFRAGASLAATVFAEIGQVDRAISITRRTIGPDGSELPRDAFWLGGMALFAGVAAAAADRPLVELVAGLLDGCADHVVIFGAGGAVLGAGHHWLGLLDAARGSTDRALDHFAAATAIAEELAAPYWIAQAKVAAAAVRRTRDCTNDSSHAARLVAEARAVAERGGYGRVLAQADALT